MYICTNPYETTMNKNRVMDLKEGKEGVYSGAWREERERGPYK